MRVWTSRFRTQNLEINRSLQRMFLIWTQVVYIIVKEDSCGATCPKLVRCSYIELICILCKSRPGECPEMRLESGRFVVNVTYPTGATKFMDAHQYGISQKFIPSTSMNGRPA
ncbi:hypothetical protein Smp_077380 [Schistosoma mansoni]|uniref:hypothetical protein n=1 Tax=Schistosoma mansoni TaxID=6183 RepID=UPI00022DC9DB|nr:hypothetical protein Smp_077380 [Schistosoma mansoni]|eukprot:XP_018655664.1 hypothetical protein Smp_077380 [Schistosoma mansoni]